MDFKYFQKGYFICGDRLLYIKSVCYFLFSANQNGIRKITKGMVTIRHLLMNNSF